MWTNQILVGLLLLRATCSSGQTNVTEATPRIEKYPFMVSIQEHGLHQCAGSIIHPIWILTAAQCVDHHNVTDLNIEYGVTKLRAAQFGPDTAYLKRIIIHEGYNELGYFENDIALLKLSRRLNFNGKNIGAVPLPDPHFNIKNQGDSEGTQANLILWDSWQEHFPTMRDANITLDPECIKRHSFPDLYIADDQFCGDGDCGIGLCSGETGDPLLLDGMQIGIASSSIGTFTNLSPYIQWIKTHTRRANVNFRNFGTQIISK